CLNDYLRLEDLFAFKLFLILGFQIVYLLLNSFFELGWPVKYILLVASVRFLYLDLWMNGTMTRIQEEVIRVMPFTVDMLVIAVEAGLDFVAAMSKVVEKARVSALVEEFEILLKEIRIGASRAEALRNLAWRIDLLPMSSFCATLIAADSVGASIGPILKALSEEIRQKKSADAEKQGATAATKILIPMMFFIIPSFFIVIFTPIILE